MKLGIICAKILPIHRDWEFSWAEGKEKIIIK